jgi:hypothetical protein
VRCFNPAQGRPPIPPLGEDGRASYTAMRWTPAGEFETRHYERVVTDAKQTRAEVWLAKDRFNFPVRVVFDQPRSLRLEQDLLDLKSR